MQTRNSKKFNSDLFTMSQSANKVPSTNGEKNVLYTRCAQGSNAGGEICAGQV